jgi:hypothetical protein
MVPSMYVVLDEFPLNANGKLDRKRLPSPDFSKQSSSAHDFEEEHHEPNDVVENQVHAVWCELLHLDRISTNRSIFSIGGHSLLIMQLYQNYTKTCELDVKTLNITELFQHPTIKDHARLIIRCQKNSESHKSAWFPLSLAEGRNFFDHYKVKRYDFACSSLSRSRVFRSSSHFSR